MGGWLAAILALGALCGAQEAQGAASKPGLEEALRVVEGSRTGAALVRAVVERWDLRGRRALLAKLAWGESSRTDAVLTRHYDPESGEEVREREVTIYLRRHAAIEDVALDLAHELVHAAQQPDWDPYDPDLTPVRFIRLSIEAEGGEVDAVQAECRVAAELGDRAAAQGVRCGRYSPGAREGIVREFYRVGAWKRTIQRALGPSAAELGELSDEEPLLLSSTGRAPYPVALLREYEALTEAACRNSRNRLAAAAPERRRPASADEPASRAAIFLSRRCAEREGS